MSRKKQNKGKKHPTTNPNSLGKAFIAVKNIKKAKFSSFQENTETLPFRAFKAQNDIDNEEISIQTQTTADIPGTSLDYRLEAMECRISESTVKSLSEFNIKFTEELSDFKSSILKWLFGILIPFALAVIIAFVTLNK